MHTYGKVNAFSLKTKISSHGYHINKETFSKVKVGNEVMIQVETNHNSFSAEPFACTIKVKHGYFIEWRTAGHILREILRYAYFFINPILGGGDFYALLVFLRSGKSCKHGILQH